MVFSSAIFLFAFLPVVLVLDRLLRSTRAKNALLIAASLLFYAFGQLNYVPLLLLTVVLFYVCGRIAAAGHGRWGVALALAGGLGALAVFKYADFALGTVNALSGLSLPLPGLALPIGISFFTFQGLSYVIDVARDPALRARSFWQVLLYISLFPQLIAGPIVQYRDVAQAIETRQTDPQSTALGVRRFICGLAKKLLLADALAQMADAAFALPAGQIGCVAAWAGAICYMLQIYFDFSGYSDMAIGMGRMFGFRFRENFAYPYTATSIRGFWRQWHISLSSWFRDYLYIPLGGNRKGRARTQVNRLTVFLATGLWHGASWNFVLWGLWHGLFSVLEDCGVIPAKKLEGKCIGRVYTLLVVMLGFVLFRADTLPQAGAMLAALFAAPVWQGTAAVLAQLTPVFVLTLAAAFFLCAPRGKQFAERHEGASLALSLGLLALCVLHLSAGTYSPFIYFRF